MIVQATINQSDRLMEADHIGYTSSHLGKEMIKIGGKTYLLNGGALEVEAVHQDELSKNAIASTIPSSEYTKKKETTPKQQERITQYNTSLTAAINKQMTVGTATVERSNKWVNASVNAIKEYLVPTHRMMQKYKYQYLDLASTAGISKEAAKKFLKNKGVLSGKEEAFLAAANTYQINEIYLMTHAALETGNGTSPLAQGVNYNGITVYNMYGIQAVDSNPIESGASYAYSMGWITPEEAIKGGAKWISEQYINNAICKQNTLYKMRWNPQAPGTHQYATDVAWAAKQAKKIEATYNEFLEAYAQFEIPTYYE